MREPRDEGLGGPADRGLALGPARPDPGPVGYRELLANRPWVVFETSAVVSGVGYALYAFAVPWIAFTSTGSVAFVGVVLAVEYGVYAATFLLAPWVDRVRDKRTVYLIAYPIQAVAAAILGSAVLAHALTAPLLLTLVVVLSVFWDAAWAANNVAPRLLLPADQLFRAQGFGGLVGGLGQIGAYAGGAVVLVAVGPAVDLFLYAGLLVLGAALVSRVALRRPSAAAAPAYWAEFRDGWRAFRRAASPALRGLGATELLRGFFTAAPALLITLVAGTVLGRNPGVYGLLFTASVGGAISTGLLLGETNPRRHVGAVLVGALAIEGTGVVAALGLVPYLLPSVGVWAVVGGAGAAYSYAFYVYLQGSVPSERLGRVAANLYVFTGVSSGVGALVLGRLASELPPLLLAGVVGAGLLGAAALLAAQGSVRRLGF